MKIVSYDAGRGMRYGVVDGDTVRDAGEDLTALQPAGETVALSAVRLGPPVRPGKIVCAGLNYRDHAEESGAPIPEWPLLFAKLGNSIAGPGATIDIPSFTTQVDYEAELGVVIGRQARRVTESDALSYVLGYTCVNDVSARDLQFADGQWTRGKTLDTFCPVGPHIVTADEIPDPQALGIRCRVNGATLQDSSTAQMIFGVAELISFISQGITLEPGDLIATGTPVGVGFARKPPIYLTDGDVVEIDIDGIGVLTNPVRAV